MIATDLRIRAAHAEDAAAVAAVYAPYVTGTAISFETEAPDAAVMRERIVQTIETHPWLIAEIDGCVAGFAYATRHSLRPGYRWTVDMTVYVDRDQRGKRIGKALHGALLATCRHQGFRSAFAEIVLPHPASIRLHEEMGFRQIGVHRDIGFKLGSWRDIAYWRLGLSEGSAAPGEPLPFSTFKDLPAFEELIRRADGTGAPILPVASKPEAAA
jgi:phosphinothricin acetyltransferase